MTDHLPECDCTDPSLPRWRCDCDRLRACEQRVAAETISRLDRWQQHSPVGRKTYEEGVQAARDAVAALAAEETVFGISVIGMEQVLAVIDALRGDTGNRIDPEQEALLDMGRRIARVRQQPSISDDGSEGYDGDDSA